MADAFTTCRIIIIHTHGSDGHIGLEDAFPDGEEILYNVHGKIVTELLFLGTCEGMKTEDMEKPMRDAGVEVVFGWSQSVKTSTDHLCISYFTDGLLRGMTAGEAIEYMKEEYCSAACSAEFWLYRFRKSKGNRFEPRRCRCVKSTVH